MKYGQLIILLILQLALPYCSKKSGQSATGNVAPSNLNITFTVSTDNSGNVSFVSKADNAVSYDYNFGNGVFQTVASGSITYKYGTSGTYYVNVIAKSAVGLTTTKSVSVTVTVVQTLAWSDEFNEGSVPDPTRWGYDIGGNGWGNNELEYYTNRPANASISNGTLKITAIKENFSGSSYTSARLITKDKFSFKYGKIEVRAKLPGGAGTWPAIWMLGNSISTAGWPACGELDIMEEKGSDPNKIYGTLHHPGHSGGNGDGSTLVISNATTEFHKYAADWTPQTIKISVDDVTFFTFNNSSSLPFNQNFFIILNMAMGGNFTGSVDPAFTSAVMEVDYVRVYQ